jgi:Fe2+ transport system protein FeoA
MGLVAGTQVEFVCKAPLGDPIEIRALGYRLSLRLAEAQSIEIVPVA